METQSSPEEMLEGATEQTPVENPLQGDREFGALKTDSDKPKSRRHNIMVVNLVGFTGTPPTMTREDVSGIQRTFHSLIDSSVALYRGAIIKNVGYAYLITFGTSSDVLKAALRIENDVQEYNRINSGHTLDVKIAVNTDEPVVSDQKDDAYRRAFNFVSKIEKLLNESGKHTESVRPSIKRPEKTPEPHIAGPHKNDIERKPPLPVKTALRTVALRRRKSFESHPFDSGGLRTIKSLRIGRNGKRSRSIWARFTTLFFLFAVSAITITMTVTRQEFRDLISFVKESVSGSRTSLPLSGTSSSLIGKSYDGTDPAYSKSRPTEPVQQVVAGTPEFRDASFTGFTGEVLATSLLNEDRSFTGTLLDDFEEADWKPSRSRGSSIRLSLVPGKKDKAIRADYDFRANGKWVQFRKNLRIDRSAGNAIQFFVRATGANVNHMEIKLVDDNGTNFGYKFVLKPTDIWEHISIRFEDFSYWWGGDRTLDEITKVYFAVSAIDGGLGSVLVDQLVLTRTEEQSAKRVAGGVFDRCDSMDGWQIEGAVGTTRRLVGIPGVQNQGIAIEYDFGTGNWVQIFKSFPIELTRRGAIRFYFKWTGERNNFEFKVTDKDGTTYGKVFDSLKEKDVWQEVVVPVSELSYWWGGKDQDLDLKNIHGLWLAVSKSNGGSGSHAIDQLEIVQAP